MNGVSQVIVVPELPFNTADAALFSSATAPTAADFLQVQQAVQNYMTTAGPVISRRLAPSSAALVIEPGVELIAPGSITLQSGDAVSPALDLSTWRFKGMPVDLTVRAAGDILIANTVSDGVASQFVGNSVQPTLMSGASASIHLVAGADLASANPLQVINGGAGTLTVGSVGGTPAQVRTGTGNIDLVAAKDVVIGNQGSGAYTAGVPAIAPGGTAADPYPNFLPRAGTEQFATDASGNPYGFGVLVPEEEALMSFPTMGGNLTVRAGEDVMGAALATPAVSIWQIREGGTNSKLALPAWGVKPRDLRLEFRHLGRRRHQHQCRPRRAQRHRGGGRQPAAAIRRANAVCAERRSGAERGTQHRQRPKFYLRMALGR